ncbi:hypothetical protein B296_00055600, partial [Ensete ventricosum]
MDLASLTVVLRAALSPVPEERKAAEESLNQVIYYLSSIVLAKVGVFESYRPIRAICTSPSATRWYHQLGLFSLYYHRNRSVTVDFDHCRPLSGGNGRFRPSSADFGQYQLREKEEEGEEEEGEEKREPRDPALLFPDPNPSPAGFSALRGENLWRSWGEENDARASRRGFASPRMGFLGRRNVSTCGEKERGD